MSKGEIAAVSVSKPCLHIDFDKDSSQVKGVAVGDVIYVVVKGTVQSVEQRESWDNPKKMMASIGLRDFTVTVDNEDAGKLAELFGDE